MANGHMKAISFLEMIVRPPFIYIDSWPGLRGLKCGGARSGLVEVRISQLYAIEEEGKDLSCAARKQLRVEKSQTVLNDLHDWLTKIRACTANGGVSAKAMDYTLGNSQ